MKANLQPLGERFRSNDAVGLSTIASDDDSSAVIVDPSLIEIPGYRILTLLGRGGMGEVYLAEHLQLKRQVAIKLLVSNMHVTDRVLARFRAESQAIAAVRHPHICQVFDVGQVGTRPYFAMEYIAGQTLSQSIRKKPPIAKEAAQYVLAIANAIQRCHEAGILHRDLKPSNIMLEPDGTVKVMDFGLAKQQNEHDVAETQTGEILGTPCYMAPEQASGLVKNLTPACDVYGIGAILYELLVGRPPHLGHDMIQTVMQVLTETPIAPRTIQSQVPRDLETICLKCLEKKPTKRYLSCLELAADLERYLAGEPIVARPVGKFELASKWANRHRALSALMGVTCLAILTAIAGTAFHVTRLESELKRSERLFSQSRQWGQWLVKDHIPAIMRVQSGSALQEALVSKTLAHLQALEQDVAADEELGIDVSGAYEKIATIEANPAFATPTRSTQAIISLRRSLDLYNQLDSKGDNSKFDFERARLLKTIAELELSLDNRDGARQAIEQALKYTPQLSWQRLSAERVARLIDAKDIDANANLEKCMALYERGKELEKTDLQDNELGLQCSAFLTLDLAESLRDLSEMKPTAIGECLAILNEATAKFERLVSADEQYRPDLAKALKKQGLELERKGQLQATFDCLSRQIEQWRIITSDYVSSENYQQQLLDALQRRFNLVRREKNTKQALADASAYFETVTPLYHSNPEKYRRDLQTANACLALAYRDDSEWDKAKEQLEQAISHGTRLLKQAQAPADVLMQAQLYRELAETEAASTDSQASIQQRIKALKTGLEYVEECLALCESIQQALTTDDDSIFWQGTRLKHQLEEKLERLVRTNIESIDGSRRLGSPTSPKE